ncbi:hemolysin family protein [Corynebacterium uropygiale]|uniref:Hemolysin family protein n=1 Tax=Corynebacterium uropygiale TaxID=1775911 RepID=A0A9X1QQ72_9CORY|nr:hemolysin family protein [Corynebacterium uropygiale]
MLHYPIAVLVLVTVLALGFAGLVGTLESAVSSISRARVEQLVKDERRGARALLHVVDERAVHINLLVLLRTLLDATAAIFAAAVASRLWHDSGWVIVAAIVAVGLVSFAIIGVFGRTLGRKNPYTICLSSAVVLQMAARIFGPITKMLIWVGNILAPGPGFRDGPYATEVELREMVDIAQEHGVVEIEERKMIQNVFDLASTTARMVMVPRPEMIWIEADKTAGQATSLCVRSGHSRIPVIGENTDDLVGVIYLKDLVEKTYHLADGGRSVTVAEVMREPVFVPDSKPLDALLHEMQVARNHIAILVDEYGAISGLVTIEDILEEIVGEISDEYDALELAPVERVGERQWRCVARLSLDDLREALEEDIEEEISFSEDTLDQVDTVAGLVAYGMGRVPLPGTSVTVEGLTLTAEGGTDRRGRLRVNTVLVELPERSPQDPRGEGEDGAR